MAGMFSKPKTPAAPPVPPPPPTMDNASADTDIAARAVQQQLDRGRTATMLTGGAGLSDTGDTKKVLLGSGG